MNFLHTFGIGFLAVLFTTFASLVMGKMVLSSPGNRHLNYSVPLTIALGFGGILAFGTICALCYIVGSIIRGL